MQTLVLDRNTWNHLHAKKNSIGIDILNRISVLNKKTWNHITVQIIYIRLEWFYKWYYLCTTKVVTFVYEFPRLNVTTIMGQKLFDLFFFLSQNNNYICIEI